MRHCHTGFTVFTMTCNLSIAPACTETVNKLGTCTACSHEREKRRLRDYYERNAEKVKTKRRRYVQENKDKISEYNDVYRVLNYDQVASKQARWRSENRERCNLKSRGRRAKMKETVLVQDWFNLVEFFGGKCLCCGSVETTADHVVPLHLGGRHHVSNLQPLCRSCNSKKGIKTTDYRPDPVPGAPHYDPTHRLPPLVLSEVSRSA